MLRLRGCVIDGHAASAPNSAKLARRSYECARGLRKGRRGQQWHRQDRRRWKIAPTSDKMAKTEAAG